MKIFHYLFIGLFILLNSSITQASRQEQSQTVIAPNCLLKNIELKHKLLSKNDNFSLLEATSSELAKLSYQAHLDRVDANKPLCGKFQDVSKNWQAYAKQSLSSSQTAQMFLSQFQSMSPPQGFILDEFEKTVYHEEIVKDHLEQIKPDRFWENLKDLSNTRDFPDRDSKSDTGLKAAEWLRDYLLNVANQAQRQDVSWSFVDTGPGYKQPSLIFRIGEQDIDNPAVISGAHMDTVSEYDFPFGVKPGADDDGSGTVVNLEVAEVILRSNLKFKHPVYFIWYAAEEVGLVGSKAVVQHIMQQQIPVDSVLHMEVAGYQNFSDENKLWVITDNVNPSLTNYLEMLALKFAGVNQVGRTRCGYACSDHASWTNKGFSAAIPAEAEFNQSNPYMHSSEDSIDKLSQSHMLKFAKLGLAFVIERASPLTK